MGVPAEIRAVERPINTVVIDRGSGKWRYAVLDRKKSIRKGKRSIPRNGKVVGHIVNYKFVPKTEESALPYGVSALVHKLMNDVQSELFQYYGISDTFVIMALTAIKVRKPNLPWSQARENFLNSFAGIIWKGAAVSKNSITSHLETIGGHELNKRAFLQNRINAVPKNSPILVGVADLQQKQDVIDLKSLTYRFPDYLDTEKTKIRSCLYGFDVERNEPLFAEYLTNSNIEASSFSYASILGVENGLVVIDSENQLGTLYEELKEEYNLHFLKLVNRNYALIEEFDLHSDFKDGFRMPDGRPLLCKKVKAESDLYYYSFLDVLKRAEEEIDWLSNQSKKGSFDPEEYKRLRPSFGTTDFVSNFDMSAENAYKSYYGRHLIELSIEYYNRDLKPQRVYMPRSFTAKGVEFINFLCTLATFRIINAAVKARLLHKMTYGEIIEKLEEAVRKIDAPLNELPTRTDGYWVNLTKSTLAVLQALGLCASDRKKKAQLLSEAKNAGSAISLKRRPGRPRKNPSAEVKPKRPRGRPRIHPIEPNKPKRPRGRPRKNTTNPTE